MHYTFCIKFLSLTFVCTPNGFLLHLLHLLSICLMRYPIRCVSLVVVQRMGIVFVFYLKNYFISFYVACTQRGKWMNWIDRISKIDLS